MSATSFPEHVRKLSSAYLHPGTIGEAWRLWRAGRITFFDFVLCVCTAVFLRRAREILARDINDDELKALIAGAVEFIANLFTAANGDIIELQRRLSGFAADEQTATGKEANDDFAITLAFLLKVLEEHGVNIDEIVNILAQDMDFNFAVDGEEKHITISPVGAIILLGVSGDLAVFAMNIAKDSFSQAQKADLRKKFRSTFNFQIKSTGGRVKSKDIKEAATSTFVKLAFSEDTVEIYKLLHFENSPALMWLEEHVGAGALAGFMKSSGFAAHDLYDKKVTLGGCVRGEDDCPADVQFFSIPELVIMRFGPDSKEFEALHKIAAGLGFTGDISAFREHVVRQSPKALFGLPLGACSATVMEDGKPEKICKEATSAEFNSAKGVKFCAASGASLFNQPKAEVRAVSFLQLNQIEQLKTVEADAGRWHVNGNHDREQFEEFLKCRPEDSQKVTLIFTGLSDSSGDVVSEWAKCLYGRYPKIVDHVECCGHGRVKFYDSSDTSK